jgi:hypothetical protein
MNGLLLLLLNACVIGAEKYPRPRDLPPGWLVDRPRILAIKAEPPEARPGDVVTFSSLIPQPGVAHPWSVVWLACAPDDSGGIGFGCTLPTDLDLSTATPADLASLGFIGLEPLIPPVYTVPSDSLNDLTDAEKLEGIYELISVTALPPEYLDPSTAPAEPDFSELASGYKRLVISEATTPNHNPQIIGFTADQKPVPSTATLHLEAGQDYALDVVLTTDSIETYTFVDSKGIGEEREEEPYLSWYASAGTVDEPFTLYPYFDATFTAPESAGVSGTIWVVLRDRRGGMDWWEQPFVSE